jgi:hypothetical protein
MLSKFLVSVYDSALGREGKARHEAQLGDVQPPAGLRF